MAIQVYVSFWHGDEGSERVVYDRNSKNSFDFDSWRTMKAEIRNLVEVLSFNVLLKRPNNNYLICIGINWKRSIMYAVGWKNRFHLKQL